MDSAIVFLLVGLLMGGLVGWLIAKLKSSSKKDNSAELEMQLKLEIERSSNLTDDLKTINQQLGEERTSVIELNNRNAKLEANYQNMQERLKEQKAELNDLQQRFAIEFKNLANDIFEEKSKKFTDQNKTNLNELLGPLGQKLNDFEKKVEQTNKESLERSTALREQINGLSKLNDQMTKEAANLTKALKGDVKTQGNWGEVILERILENSGLEKNREYFLQETFQNEVGKRLRPDVIIKLPENKNLVVDSKVSLTAYEKYMSEEDEAERATHLKAHIMSLRAHVRGLAEKNYHQLFDGGSLDFVLMFVPIESAFALMYQGGENLYNEAHEKNIITGLAAWMG